MSVTNAEPAPASSSARVRLEWAAWCWAILGVLPYWLPYADHFIRAAEVPTGFLFNDMPYYAANGRAVFERGNGLAGPNPYDSDPDAPAIYFHWITWLLGFGIVRIGLDPGLCYLGIGAIGGLASARVTFALVRTVLPATTAAGPLFLLAMWGGGLLVPVRVMANLIAGNTPWDDPMMLDPFGGQWSFYWGRVLIYPTEAVYHSLVSLAWLAVLRGRPLLSVLPAALLAATHPFSGIQLLAILGLWWLARGVTGCRPAAWRIEGALLGLVGLAFLAYYFVFLEQFPQHRRLRETWTLQWSPGLLTQILAYGPVLALAIVRIRNAVRLGQPMPDSVRFLLVAAGVSFALSNHHWVATPHQPMHFTRGYVWLPLLLVGLSELQQWVISKGRAGRAALLVLLAAACLDNVTFVTCVIARTSDEEFQMTSNEWDMLAAIRDRHEQGVLVSQTPVLGYLAATYTSARPYVGHAFNTPDLKTKKAEVSRWLETGEPASWLANIDLVLLPRAEFVERGKALGLTSPAWEMLRQNDDFVLLHRR